MFLLWLFKRIQKFDAELGELAAVFHYFFTVNSSWKSIARINFIAFSNIQRVNTIYTYWNWNLLYGIKNIWNFKTAIPLISTIVIYYWFYHLGRKLKNLSISVWFWMHESYLRWWRPIFVHIHFPVFILYRMQILVFLNVLINL